MKVVFFSRVVFVALAIYSKKKNNRRAVLIFILKTTAVKASFGILLLNIRRSGQLSKTGYQPKVQNFGI